MSLSLYTIEDSLDHLLEAREQARAHIEKLEVVIASRPGELAHELAEAKQELAVVEKTLAEYERLEVLKVDNCHRYLATLKNLVPALRAEAAAISGRARRMEECAAWLKERLLNAMELGNKKRVDGTNGRYLLRKGNGGLKPLQVDGWDDEKKQWTSPLVVLPDELIDVTVKMPLQTWNFITSLAEVNEERYGLDGATLTGSEPSNERIRAALGEDCPGCNGGFVLGPEMQKVTCEACSGTGKRIVPGARLLDRGQHLEVK